jgi:hypothetical protein
MKLLCTIKVYKEYKNLKQIKLRKNSQTTEYFLRENSPGVVVSFWHCWTVFCTSAAVDITVVAYVIAACVPAVDCLSAEFLLLLAPLYFLMFSLLLSYLLLLASLAMLAFLLLLSSLLLLAFLLLMTSLLSL